LLFQLLAHVLCKAWQVGVVVPEGGFTERIHDTDSWLTVDTVGVGSVIVDSPPGLVRKMLHGQGVCL